MRRNALRDISLNWRMIIKWTIDSYDVTKAEWVELTQKPRQRDFFTNLACVWVPNQQELFCLHE
jgi:hypothetical protein